MKTLNRAQPLNLLLFVGCFALSLLTSKPAIAGWTSGGGELVRDANNPWFLPNTTQATYCILVDEKNFGQSKEQIRPFIVQAFQFWRTQFLNTEDNGFLKSPLGQQKFVEVSCVQKPDIQFLFGLLSGEQIQQVGDPTKYVGITIRTDYDRTNLKGKGFVYFSPQDGPLKLKTLDGSNSKPWSEQNGILVLPALIHEIGHVYGMPHSDDYLFMDERLLEEMFDPKNTASTAKAWANNVSKNLDRIRLFKPISDTFSSEITCSKSANWNYFITGVVVNYNSSLDGPEICRSYEIKDGSFRIFVYSNAHGEHKRLLGTAANLSAVTTQYLKLNSPIKIWLPQEQKVFKNVGLEVARPSITSQRSFSYYGEFVYANEYIIDDPMRIPTNNLPRKIRLDIDSSIYIQAFPHLSIHFDESEVAKESKRAFEQHYGPVEKTDFEKRMANTPMPWVLEY